MEELSLRNGRDIASLDEETAASVLAELDERLTTQIVEKLDPEKAADILRKWPRRRRTFWPIAEGDFDELLEEMPNQKPAKFANYWRLTRRQLAE